MENCPESQGGESFRCSGECRYGRHCGEPTKDGQHGHFQRETERVGDEALAGGEPGALVDAGELLAEIMRICVISDFRPLPLNAVSRRKQESGTEAAKLDPF